MALTSVASHFTISSQEGVKRFFDNLDAIEKLCEGHEDLRRQIHNIADHFLAGMTEHEPNTVLCPMCSSIYCHINRRDGAYYIQCLVPSCEHYEATEKPAQEVIDYLDKQDKEYSHPF